MQHVIDQIMGILLNPTLIMFAAMAVEFILRMVKSEKPLSIIYAVAGGFKAVAAVIGAVGVFLDKVLPQRLAAPKE